MSRQVSRRNPYDRTNPVTGNDFYGRRRLLTELVDDLRQGHVCGVFGLRKTGKTSLVTELGRQFVKDDAGNRVFIYRDLEVLPSDPERQVPQLVSDIAKQAHTSFRVAGMRTHEVSQLSSYPTVGELRQALQASLTHSGSRNKTVVIALDEIESLVGPDAASYHRQTSRCRIPWWPAKPSSGKRKLQCCYLWHHARPFYECNVVRSRESIVCLGQPFFVTALTRTDTDEMIRSLGARMAVQWQDAALNLLFDVTGGHVFLARSLAAAVSNELSLRIEERTVTAADVRARLRSWRRSTAGIIDSMLDALARFYEEELAVFDLGIAGTPFDDLEREYPNQINNLLALGLLEEKADELQLTPWVRLSSRSIPVAGSLMWYSELVEVSIRRRHVFWHSGALHRVEPLDSVIEASVPEGCSVTIVDCRRPPLTRERDLDVQAHYRVLSDLLVVTNVDQLLRAKRGHAWLRQLRSPVMQLLDKSTAVLIASNVPRRCYPAVDGSSVATDCYQYVMRPDAQDALKSMQLDTAATRLVDEGVRWITGDGSCSARM